MMHMQMCFTDAHAEHARTSYASGNMVLTCSTCSSAGRGGPYMKYSKLHVGQVKGHTYDIEFLPMNQIRLAHSQDNSLIGTPLSMFEPLRSCNHDTLPTPCVLILIIGAFLFQSVLFLIVHVIFREHFPVHYAV